MTANDESLGFVGCNCENQLSDDLSFSSCSRIEIYSSLVVIDSYDLQVLASIFNNHTKLQIQLVVRRI